MACEDWEYAIDAAKANEYVEWIWCPMADQLGAPVAGLLIYGGVGTYLYIRTGSMVLPVQLAIIFGGAALSWVTATAVSIVAAAVLFIVAVLATLLVRRIGR